MSSSLCAIPVSAWRPRSRPERSNRSLRPNRPAAGRGSGLSQVFGTARQSGGGVEIDSIPGKGTAVSVYLPRARAPAGSALKGPEEIVEIKSGEAVVLVVDDDSAVLSTIAAILKNIGYSVLQAESGATALALLDNNRSIDLLLTDVS